MPFSQQIKRILECSLQLKQYSPFPRKIKQKYKNIKELKTYNPWNSLDMIL